MKSAIPFHVLSTVRKQYRSKKIVFASGCFDITHTGHVLFFEDCKKQGDILVVAVSPDKMVSQYKKGRPVLNEQLRLHMVASLKPVDYCFIHPNITFASTDEMIVKLCDDIFPKLKPDVYVINTDAASIPARRKLVECYPGMTLRVLKRTAPKKFEKVSTSGIIKKIQKLPKTTS